MSNDGKGGATVGAKLELGATKLLYQQGTPCVTELQNSGKTTLRGVNPGNAGGSATLVLTDVKTGEATTHVVPPGRGSLLKAPELEAGDALRYEFFLPHRLKAPGPGVYELRAKYQWDTGEISSAPVRLEFRPSVPRAAHLASPCGGIASAYHAAWINHAAPDKEEFELWLSDLSTVGKPRVGDCWKLADLKRVVQPYLSVPANKPPAVQWIGWVDEQSLCYLAHRDGKATAPQTLPLPSAHCRILPPLLQNPVTPGEPVPGADVALCEAVPGAMNWQLHVVRLKPDGKAGQESFMNVAGFPPDWAQTVSLSNNRRWTFLLVPEAGRGTLKLLEWSPAALPGVAAIVSPNAPSFTPSPAPVALAALEAVPLAADLCLTSKDVVHGAILAEVGEAGTGRYAFYRWSYAGTNKLTLFDPQLLLWPSNAKITRASVGVSECGAAYALLRTDEKEGEKKWFFCDADGTVAPLTGPAASLREPAQILFRRGDDPTILHTDPGRGFQFAKPG